MWNTIKFICFAEGLPKTEYDSLISLLADFETYVGQDYLEEVGSNLHVIAMRTDEQRRVQLTLTIAQLRKVGINDIEMIEDIEANVVRQLTS